jgi:hypothetical protein
MAMFTLYVGSLGDDISASAMLLALTVLAGMFAYFGMGMVFILHRVKNPKAPRPYFVKYGLAKGTYGQSIRCWPLQ